MKGILLSFLVTILFSSCQQGNSENGSETVGVSNETTDIWTKVNLPTRSTQRVTSTDIETITITVSNNDRIYYKDEPFLKSEDEWSIELFDIPIDTEVTFLAEAQNSDGFKILEGEVSKTLSKETSSILIPISVVPDNSVISLPVLESAVESDGESSASSLTFTLSNPNADFITWKVIPDPEMAKISEVGFEAIDGTRDTDDGSIKGEIDFNTIVGDKAEITIGFIGELGNIIYNKNQFILTNSLGDQSVSLFSLYSPRDEIEISLAPIEEKIFINFYDDRLEAKALIYGDFPRFGIDNCKNDFEDLNNFQFSDRTYENLLTHYYDTIYEGLYRDDFGNYIDVNETIIYLKENFDQNFSRLMNTDINDSWDTIFGELQSQYYDDFDFKELDAVLYGIGFQNMLEYFIGQKSLLVAFESYYGDDRRGDYNTTLISILKKYKIKIGSNFETFLEFMVDEPSTMLVDFNATQKQFLENSDYYYTKFQATDDFAKEQLHSFVAKLQDEGFINFQETFSTDGMTIYDLLKTYYDLPDINGTEEELNDDAKLYKRIKEKFAKLVDIRPNESLSTLLENLKSKYDVEDDEFKNFLTLHENRGFEEFKEYYVEHHDLSPQLVSSLELKYDETVCKQRVETENIRYSWRYESEPENTLGITNPLFVPFHGTLKDTLVLEARRVNADEITESKVEYKIDIDVQNYKDLAGNDLILSFDENNTIGENNETNETVVTEIPKGDPKYRFDLNKPVSEVELIYGEEITLNFTAEPPYNLYSFDNDLIGRVIGTSKLFTVEVKRTKENEETNLSRVDFNVTIKANEEKISGEANLDILVENTGYAEVETIKVIVSSPVVNIQVDGFNYDDEVIPEIRLIEDSKRIIPIYAESIREGISLDFELDTVANFDVGTAGLPTFSNAVDGITYNLHATPQSGSADSESEEELLVTITARNEANEKLSDETVKIKLISEKSEDIEFSNTECGEENIYGYETISDTNKSDSNVPASDLNISVVSLNSYPSEKFPEKYENDEYSKIILFYSPDSSINTTSAKIGEIDIFNKNTFNKIGFVNFSKEALGKSFYVKYFDEMTKKLICEKMSFPDKL
jgi:hypothetical protein